MFSYIPLYSNIFPDIPLNAQNLYMALKLRGKQATSEDVLIPLYFHLSEFPYKE